MDLVKIGRYIAEKRKGLGLTQKQLAEKLNMSDKSVSKWERGVCLPDVSVYIELCDILGISINEFLAGEDIRQEDLVKQSEDNIIEVTKDSKHRMKNMKGIIAVLIAICVAAVSTLGILAYRHIRQPRNYISAVAWDSVEMKTAELLSGVDGAFLFDYASKESFRQMKIYMTEYRSGEMIRKSEIGALEYEDIESPAEGKIVVVPDFDHQLVQLIVADDCAKYSTELPILEGVDSEYFLRTSSVIDETMSIRYNEEQGLLALIYGANGAVTTSIDALELGIADEVNDYMYYISVVFEK